MELKENECSCKICVNMCERPCWGTPDEIQKIIDAGFGHKLMIDWWENSVTGDRYLLCGALVGYEKTYAPSKPLGKCAFLTKENLCEIHNIKPAEGRVSHCNSLLGYNQLIQNLRNDLSVQWQSEKGKQIFNNWKKTFFIGEEL